MGRPQVATQSAPPLLFVFTLEPCSPICQQLIFHPMTSAWCSQLFPLNHCYIATEPCNGSTCKRTHLHTDLCLIAAVLLQNAPQKQSCWYQNVNDINQCGGESTERLMITDSEMFLYWCAAVWIHEVCNMPHLPDGFPRSWRDVFLDVMPFYWVCSSHCSEHHNTIFRVKPSKKALRSFQNVKNHLSIDTV